MQHLAWAREEAELTQTELGELIGRGRSYISDLECGHREATDEEAEQIAEALGYEVADLL